MPRFLTILTIALVTSLSASAATTVAQRLLRADGTAYTGKFKISWPTYTNASGAVVRAGYSTVTLESDGDFTVSLAPHINSPASGPIYTVDYNELKQGTRQTEYWDVPDTVSTLDIADVLTVAPASTPSSISSLPSLSVVGTITTGVWNATAVAAQYGGTGDNTSATTGIPYIAAGNWQYNSDVSNTELGYLDNVTSAIQTQIDAKAAIASIILGVGNLTTTGAIPYVSASGTLNQDACINRNTSFKIDISCSGSSGTVRFFDQTATTGFTSVALKAGEGQGVVNLLLFENFAGTTMGGIGSGGDVFTIASGKRKVAQYQNYIYMTSDSAIQFKSVDGLDDAGNFDTCLIRSGAGEMAATDCSGAYRDLKLRNIRIASVAAIDGSLENSQCSLHLTSNTNFQVRCKGSDSTVRLIDLTLAP